MINDSLISFLICLLDVFFVMVVFSSFVSLSFTAVHLLILLSQIVVKGARGWSFASGGLVVGLVRRLNGVYLFFGYQWGCLLFCWWMSLFVTKDVVGFVRYWGLSPWSSPN